jgi:hypothetical protein
LDIEAARSPELKKFRFKRMRASLRTIYEIEESPLMQVKYLFRLRTSKITGSWPQSKFAADPFNSV